jgi:hypothetical protein
MIFKSCLCKARGNGSLFFLVFNLLLLSSCASTQYLPNVSGDVKKSSVFVHTDKEIVHLFLIDNEPRDFISNKFFQYSYSAAGDPGQFNIGITPGNHSFVLYTNKYWNEPPKGGSFRVDLNMEEGKTYILKRKSQKDWFVECNNEEVKTAKITSIAAFTDYTGSDAAFLTISPFKTDNKVLDDKSWQSIDVYYIDKTPGEAKKSFMGPFLNNYDTKRTICLSPGEHEILLIASTRSYNAPSILQKLIISLKPGEKAHLEITNIEAVSGGAQVTIRKITDI